MGGNLIRNFLDLYCVKNAQDHDVCGPQIQLFSIILLIVVTEKRLLCLIQVSEKMSLCQIHVSENCYCVQYASYNPIILLTLIYQKYIKVWYKKLSCVTLFQSYLLHWVCISHLRVLDTVTFLN